MVRFFIYTCFLLAFSSNLNAQLHIRGKVLNNQQNPIAFSNIILYQAKDSSFVKGTSSDNLGAFHFDNLSSGKYKIEVSYIGYKPLTKTISLDKNVNLGTFILKAEESLLEQVAITLRKPKLIQLADRLIFEVANTSLSTSSAWDIAKHTPGVVNLGDKLMVKGAQASVYINNRKVYLSPEEVQNMLENYSGEAVDKIELITNPSTAYDANERVILNIVTNSLWLPGYKGSVAAQYKQGVYAKYQLNSNHFYKTKKLNLFANLSFSPEKKLKQDESYINFLNNQDLIYENWQTDFEKTTQARSYQLNTAIDYILSNKEKLLLSLNTNFTPFQEENIRGKTQIFNSQKTRDSLFNTRSLLDTERLNLGLNLAYHYQINEQSLIKAHYHQTFFDRNINQDIQTIYKADDLSVLNENSFTTDANQKIDIYATGLDFENSFKNIDFVAGIKLSHINSENSLAYTNIKSDAQAVQNVPNFNAFDYRENIWAAYTSLKTNLKKWTAQGGLRVEHTYRKGENAANTQNFKREYTSLFPKINLSYAIDEKQQLVFDYSRNIDRPNYELLNPFSYFINENSLRTGNEKLLAAISSNFSFKYLYGNNYSLDLYYRDNGRNTTQLTFQDNSLRLLQNIPLNAIDSKSWGLDVFHGRYLFDWWYAQAILSVFHEEERFPALLSPENAYTNEVNGFYSSLYSSFTLSKDQSWSADASFLYISNYLSGSFVVDNLNNLTIGVKKSLWNNKGELSLQIADIFNQYASRLKSVYLNQNNGYYALPENRYVQLGFTYNFGNTLLKDNQRTIDQSERERLD